MELNDNMPNRFLAKPCLHKKSHCISIVCRQLPELTRGLILEDDLTGGKWKEAPAAVWSVLKDHLAD